MEHQSASEGEDSQGSRQQVVLGPPPLAEEKVKIQLVPVGGLTPIMKKNKFRIAGRQKFSAVTQFLRQLLQLKDHDSLFIYCQSAFCPGPDQQVAELFQCFGRSDELQLYYSIQEAWG
mmetsp:Transcript_18060/g.52755  ORF Transcript_18060/g.52755 Transcript_18060/m.52755 type:complete len:118 (-) Transcript_18060:291-644(-)